MSSRIPAPVTALIAVVSHYAAKRGPFSRLAKSYVGAEYVLFFIIVALFIVSGVPETARAQDFVRNSVYAEGSTSGLRYSINYERRLSVNAVARTGVMFRT